MNHRSLLRQCLLASLLTGAASVSHAQLVVPEGAVYDLGAGVSDQGCTDLHIAGHLILAAGGAITGVRNLVVTATGQIDLNGASIQLSQGITHSGPINGPGQIIRVDGGTACPLVGAAGPININGPVVPTAATPVPTTGGLALGLLGALLALVGGRRLNRRNGLQSGVTQ